MLEAHQSIQFILRTLQAEVLALVEPPLEEEDGGGEEEGGDEEEILEVLVLDGDACR